MQTPIPTAITIAPRGSSFHGSKLKADELGLPCNPHITPREQALIDALQRIVLETMHYSPQRRLDADSYLPEEMVEDAQRALAGFGLRVQIDSEQVAA